jgi:hypothetical protein
VSEETPVTEDTVAGDFFDAIDTYVVGEIGLRSGLRGYTWPDDDSNDENYSWPFVVVRDGREFEVDIDVRVTELTPQLKAARTEGDKRILEMLTLARPEVKP